MVFRATFPEFKPRSQGNLIVRDFSYIFHVKSRRRLYAELDGWSNSCFQGNKDKSVITRYTSSPLSRRESETRRFRESRSRESLASNFHIENDLKIKRGNTGPAPAEHATQTPRCFSIQVKSIHSRMKILLIKYWRVRETPTGAVLLFAAVWNGTAMIRWNLQLSGRTGGKASKSYRVNSFAN